VTLLSHQHGVIFNISLVATSLLFVGLELERQPISKLNSGHVTSWNQHGGAVIYLLRALQISITTSTESAIVLGCGSSKILQSILGNMRGSAGHCM